MASYVVPGDVDSSVMTDSRAKQAVVERAAYDQRWSDHAPVTVQYR
ncbi:hypothetical protein APR12_004319 [Nocardia amikacinitolerans]|nr:hypothetical protein [Nocardia amikacinitolerans]